jgi:hypothetical protein
MTPLSTRQSLPARGYGEYTANASLSGTIPYDDTIPQNTEGDQIVTATITLKSASNRVRARFVGFVAGADSAVIRVSAAMFCSTSANAINAIVHIADNDAPGSNRYNLCIEAEHAPGSVGPLTYQVRAGAEGTAYSFNATTPGSRIFGGAAKATLILEEVFV